jgi:TolA-binding protein
MKLIVFSLLFALAITVSGCAKDGAKELFETAKLEELQHNTDHALQLYQEIVEKYPNSEYATTAQGRLDALQKRP